MWYTRIIESGSAWDVLSTKEAKWNGSFSKTFKDFSFYSPVLMPTMTAMLDLIAEIEKGKNNNSILDKYYEKAKNDRESFSDISSFCFGLSKFIDSEMKKQGSAANTDMMKVLDFLGNLNNFMKLQGKTGIQLGQRIMDFEKPKTYVNSTLGIGFTTLNLLLRKGTKMSDSLAMYVLRGDDVKHLGYPMSEQRNFLISQLIDAKPDLINFQDHENVINLIKDGKTEQYLPLIREYVYSGIDEVKLLNLIFELLLNGTSQKDVADMVYGIPEKNNIDLVINCEEYPQFTSFCNILVDKLYFGLGENEFSSNILLTRKLKSCKTFMKLIESKGENCSPIFIIKGLAKPEVIISYLNKNPEDYEKFDINLLDSLGDEIKNKIIQNGFQAKTKIQADGLALFDKAEKEGVIIITKASNMTYNYAWNKGPKTEQYLGNMSESEERQKQKSDEIFTKSNQSYEDRMKQEAPFAGVNEEDISKYADQMVIIEFDTNSLKNFMIRNDVPKLKIGSVDMIDEKWGGLFVPKFPTKDRGPVPAILIKTDVWGQLAYHQALAENIGMSPDHYTEATRRHEVAHALQYLQSGDLMMQDAIALNPELTPEEAYIANPSELYARIHGDIPYLLKIFDAHIGKLMSDRKIYEAAKEQWILDIQNEMVHLMSGGTNAKRLIEDMESGRFGFYTTSTGQTLKLSDPLAAINKKLQRQRNKLEMIFHETFRIQGRRDYRRELIGKKNQLTQEIESTPIDSYRRIDIEKELKEVVENLVESGKMLIFDVKDVSEAVIEGYLADYYSKIGKAVADGLLTTDIINPEAEDKRIENEQLREEAKKQEPPTAQDIQQHARFQIQQTEPIPSGRKIDVIIPRHVGPGRPPGNFPGFDDAEQDDEQVAVEVKKDPDKTAKVYNFRKNLG